MAMSGGNGDGLVSTNKGTPLVDVLFGLLIIFFVTTPNLQQGVDVDLPKAKTASLQGKNEQVVLSIDKQGQVYLGKDNKLELETLAKKIAAVMKDKPAADQKVYIQADKSLDYGRIMEVMGKLHQGGITQIGLVSAMPEIQAEQTKQK